MESELIDHVGLRCASPTYKTVGAYLIGAPMRLLFVKIAKNACWPDFKSMLSQSDAVEHALKRRWLYIPILGIIIPKMGMVENSGLAGALFTKTQRRVLGLLFGNPDRSFYVNEIVRFAGAGIGAVQRELERLAVAHLVTVTKLGNQKHYQANRQAPIFEELRGIALKTFGVADYLREALAPLAKSIFAAFIYGSVAKKTDTASSDIDVMIVSDELSFPDVIEALAAAEGALARSINPSVYGRNEWRRKFAEKGGFLQRVMKQPRIFLVGSDDEIPKARKSGKDR